MNIISALLILISATLASGRNVLIKGFSAFSFKKREFFIIQATVFGAGTVALLFVNLFSFKGISLFTVLFALVYGVLLLCAQWCYTIALSKGKTGICATIYSFGFLIPTLSGAIFWNEKITIFGFLGIAIVIPVLIVSGMGKKSASDASSKNGYLLPLMLALVCSGGLGVVQKIQQKSPYSGQTNTFVLVAFIFCLLASLSLSLTLKRGETKIRGRNLLFGSVVGIFFSTCNLLNTFLAGRLDSSIFFPTLNIAGILLSTLFGVIIYKEKITGRDLVVLVLSIASIILVNF